MDEQTSKSHNKINYIYSIYKKLLQQCKMKYRKHPLTENRREEAQCANGVQCTVTNSVASHHKASQVLHS